MIFFLIIGCIIIAFISVPGFLFFIFLYDYFYADEDGDGEFIEQDIYNVNVTLRHELNENVDEKPLGPLR